MTHIDAALRDTVNALSDVERKAYRDAYYIANGAGNPAGIALTVHETVAALYRQGYGTSDAARHPAVVAMVGQLAYVTGQGLGPSLEIWSQVKAVYDALEAIDQPLPASGVRLTTDDNQDTQWLG